MRATTYYAGLLLSAGSLALGFSYGNNSVYFTMVGGSQVSLNYVKLDCWDFSITDGQDPYNLFQCPGSSTWATYSGVSTGYFTAGRHASSEVAEYWYDNIHDTESTFGSDPGSLNFAMIGALLISFNGGSFGYNDPTKTLSLHYVGIAQGHSDSGNNWWFGVHDGESSGQYTERNDAVRYVFEDGTQLKFYRGTTYARESKDGGGFGNLVNIFDDHKEDPKYQNHNNEIRIEVLPNIYTGVI